MTALVNRAAPLLIAAAVVASLPAAARAQAPAAVEPALPPRTLPYAPGQPVPAGYHLEVHMNKTALMSGIGMFAATYVVSLLSVAVIDVFVFAFEGHRATAIDPLLIPLAGPFIAIHT